MTDETLGGYVSAHRCPPAFSGSDGASYSAEIFVDEEPQDDNRFGAAVLFIRWSAADSQPEGHLETDYLAYGPTAEAARTAVENLTLHDLKEHLDRMIEESKGRPVW
jgi:hypothetical protein